MLKFEGDCMCVSHASEKRNFEKYGQLDPVLNLVWKYHSVFCMFFKCDLSELLAEFSFIFLHFSVLSMRCMMSIR